MNVKEDKKIKSFIFQNFQWILALVFTIFNLYLASLLTPLKQDIQVMAERIDKIEATGTVSAQITSVKVENIEKNLEEVKQIVKDINDKLDRHIDHY